MSRAIKALADAGITLEEASLLTDWDLLGVPGVGRKAVLEIREAITKMVVARKSKVYPPAPHGLLNLTPHAITISNGNGRETVIPPSGHVARVVTLEEVTSRCLITGAEIVTRTLGDVEGLPPVGTPCLVSSMVLAAVPGRAGVFAPDTGATAIREGGQIVAVTRLVAA